MIKQLLIACNRAHVGLYLGANLYLPVPKKKVNEVEDVTDGPRRTRNTMSRTAENPYAWQQQDEQTFTLGSIALTGGLLASTASPFVEGRGGSEFVSNVQTDFKAHTKGRVSEAIAHQKVPGEPDIVYLKQSRGCRWLLWRFRKHGDRPNAKAYNIFVVNPLKSALPSLWELYRQKNPGCKEALVGTAKNQDPEDLEKSRKVAFDICMPFVTYLTSDSVNGKRGRRSDKAFEAEDRSYKVTRLIKHPRAWCALVVDYVEGLSAAYPAAWPSLSMNCQSYASALTNVAHYSQLAMELVSIPEIYFEAPYCIVKMNAANLGCLETVLYTLSIASSSYRQCDLPVVHVSGRIPSWALPAGQERQAGSLRVFSDVGLAACGCCQATSAYGTMAANSQPIPNTLIAYDQTNYFIETSVAYQQCLKDLRNKHGGPLAFQNYHKVPVMQELIDAMKFMGPEEPGCRQPGDYAIPQPGDIKAEEGTDGVGETKGKTKRPRESGDAGKQPPASSDKGPVAKRQRNTRGNCK
eukprot:g9738.t1